MTKETEYWAFVPIIFYLYMKKKVYIWKKKQRRRRRRRWSSFWFATSYQQPLIWVVLEVMYLQFWHMSMFWIPGTTKCTLLYSSSPIRSLYPPHHHLGADSHTSQCPRYLSLNMSKKKKKILHKNVPFFSLPSSTQLSQPEPWCRFGVILGFQLSLTSCLYKSPWPVSSTSRIFLRIPSSHLCHHCPNVSLPHLSQAERKQFTCLPSIT